MLGSSGTGSSSAGAGLSLSPFSVFSSSVFSSSVFSSSSFFSSFFSSIVSIFVSFAGSSGNAANTAVKSAHAASNSASASVAFCVSVDPDVLADAPDKPAAAQSKRARSYRRCASAIDASWKSGFTSSASLYRASACDRRSTTSSNLSHVAMAAPGGPPSSTGGSLPPSIALRAAHMCTLPQLKSASAAASWNFSDADASISSAPAIVTAGSSAWLHFSRPSECKSRCASASIPRCSRNSAAKSRIHSSISTTSFSVAPSPSVSGSAGGTSSTMSFTLGSCDSGETFTFASSDAAVSLSLTATATASMKSALVFTGFFSPASSRKEI
mmetsp:Transcript_6559/g.22043  ORF Transcript_6559/g.22043 Transcript_6559/m.22043 type:complete len:327 (+) Transcript_6559:252-1232(+)